jgi:hypothetical protein
MDYAIAKWVAAAIAVLLVGSGIYQFVPSSARPSMLGVTLVVGGTAIVYGRSWGYYIVYLLAFSNLMSPQRTWLIPVGQSIRHSLWLYAGMEPELISITLSILCAALLGWTHYVLSNAHQLDRPLSITTRHWTAIGALVISIALVLVPTFKLIYLLAIDPFGSGGPAAPGGGVRAVYYLYGSWSLVLVGLVGACVSLVALKRIRPSLNVHSDSQVG